MDLWNIGIVPQHFTAPQLRRTRLECANIFFTLFKSYRVTQWKLSLFVCVFFFLASLMDKKATVCSGRHDVGHDIFL